jgi:hypothetical protein
VKEPVRLTIQPGSELDKAIDALVEYELGINPMIDIGTVMLVDPHDSGHMVAIGCRLDCRRRGKTDPSQLTHEEYHGWYGQRL